MWKWFLLKKVPWCIAGLPCKCLFCHLKKISNVYSDCGFLRFALLIPICKTMKAISEPFSNKQMGTILKSMVSSNWKVLKYKSSLKNNFLSNFFNSSFDLFHFLWMWFWEPKTFVLFSVKTSIIFPSSKIFSSGTNWSTMKTFFQ